MIPDAPRDGDAPRGRDGNAPAAADPHAPDAPDRRPAQDGDPSRSDEAEIALEELHRVRDLPPPTDPAAVGCTTAAVSVVTLVLMPFLGRAFSLAGVTMGWIGLALLVVAVLGALVGFLGDGLARRRDAERVRARLAEVLAAQALGEGTELARSSVRLLAAAHAAARPANELPLDVDRAAGELGAALPHVVRIERLLVERGELDPVFTARSSP